MLIKAQVQIDGVARDILIDPIRDWVCIKFTPQERMIIGSPMALPPGEALLAAPQAQMKSNMAVLQKWAKDWPQSFYSGHRRPAGGLVLPGGVVDQDKDNG